MTFAEWYNDLEARHDANYGGYEDLLEECWYAAQEALIAKKEAADCAAYKDHIASLQETE